MRIEKLGNVIEILSGYAFQSSLFNEIGEGLPLIRVRDVNSGFAGIYYSGKYEETFLINNNDLLIGLDGDFKCVLWNNGKALLNQRVCKIISKNDLIKQNYLFHFLPSALNEIHRNTNFTTVKHLSTKTIKEIQIPLPSLDEQIRIAEILTQAENLITQRKESILLLDELLKSTFLEMFGDPVRNDKGWEKVPLKKFGDVITGNTPPRGDLENFSNDYIEWIKTDNIKEKKLYITKAIEFLSEKGLKKSRFVEKGALMVACIAGSIDSVGRAGLSKYKVSFNQQINAIQPNADVNSYFLYWLFKNSKKYVQNHSSKGMKKILTKGQFEKIVMIKPPIELQNKFASIVEKVETLKREYQESLKELENMYGVLSQKAFKRVLKVKEYSNNEVLGMVAETRGGY